jgi:hypothetical protein
MILFLWYCISRPAIFLNNAEMNLLHYCITLYMYVHPAIFLFFLCFKPASPYCIEGGGGIECVLMYSNKYSINLKNSRRRVRPILKQLKHLSTVLYLTAQFYDKVQQIINGKNRVESITK